MSAFFGELRNDGGPVAEMALASMADAAPWYGTDGRGTWRAPGIGLGVLQRFSTPESRHEPPILVDHETGRVLAGSFRIDNRGELISALALDAARESPLTDAELILAAHAAWGDACPERLTGDFAFALWDATERRLLLVRDQIGIVPLFCFETSTGSLFASDLRILSAHPDGPKRLDPAAIAHHLRDVAYSLGDRTYLAGVRRLAPGHLIVGPPGMLRQRRYWTPAQAPRVVLPDAGAYAERLRALFEEAVAARLRSIAPVGAHVSGGLDSTAIALEAQRQLARRGESLAGAYSWLPAPEVEQASSDPEYIASRHAEIALGMKIESVELTPAALRRELERNIALEGYADFFYESLVRERASARGIRTLLSGWGGDDVVTSGVNGYAAELFWTGRWLALARLFSWRDRQLARDLPSQARRPAWRRALGFLQGQVVLPSLPAVIYRHWPGTRMAPLAGFDPRDPWLDDLGGRLPPVPCGQKAVGKRAEMARALTAGHLQDRIEAWSMQGARDGIRYCYPLLDRRLVEFCLGSPAELFISQDRTRWLFRAAMSGLLPDELRLASVKIETTRVSRLVDILRTTLNEPGSELDPGQCFARVRRRQVERMHEGFELDRLASGPD